MTAFLRQREAIWAEKTTIRTEDKGNKPNQRINTRMKKLLQRRQTGGLQRDTMAKAQKGLITTPLTLREVSLSVSFSVCMRNAASHPWPFTLHRHQSN